MNRSVQGRTGGFSLLELLLVMVVVPSRRTERLAKVFEEVGRVQEAAAARAGSPADAGSAPDIPSTNDPALSATNPPIADPAKAAEIKVIEELVGRMAAGEELSRANVIVALDRARRTARAGLRFWLLMVLLLTALLSLFEIWRRRWARHKPKAPG